MRVQFHQYCKNRREGTNPDGWENLENVWEFVSVYFDTLLPCPFLLSFLFPSWRVTLSYRPCLERDPIWGNDWSQPFIDGLLAGAFLSCKVNSRRLCTAPRINLIIILIIRWLTWHLGKWPLVMGSRIFGQWFRAFWLAFLLEPTSRMLFTPTCQETENDCLVNVELIDFWQSLIFFMPESTASIQSSSYLSSS